MLMRAEDWVSKIAFISEDKTIGATFHADQGDLVLSARPSKSLPSAMSGSQAAAGADETLVF